MPKKAFFTLIVITASLVSAFLLLNSSKPAPQVEKNTACCKQDVKECSLENKGSNSGDMIIDNLSRQFISIGSLCN